VKGKFDLIIFNAPYLRHNAGEDNSNDLVSGEKGIELSLRFIDSALLHMKANGRAILVSSSLSEFDALQDHIKKKSLKVLERKTVHIFFEDIIVLLISGA
jgi:release factor glutamine methyltransferase